MPPDRPTTLHDVAARVGVSPKTVSRVVRDEGGFSEDTRQRVLAAVEELGYRPNAHARGLISGRSGTIGFVAPVLSDPFFPELADGVQDAARAEGLTVLVSTTQADDRSQLEVLTSMEAHRPEGIVIFPNRHGDRALLPFLDRGLTMVLIDSELDHPNAISVRSDLAVGTQRAVDHLLARGCRRLVMLGQASDVATEARHVRFMEAAPERTQPFVADTDINMESGRTVMSRLLQEHPEIDGVFCFNDVLAIGAIQAARDAGRAVPDDLAVVGFDDIEMGAVVSPALTTVRIDRARVGAEAVRRLVARTHDAHSERSVVFPVELIIRDSA